MVNLGSGGSRGEGLGPAGATAEAAPLPPHTPANAVRRLARFALPNLITGAQPILPPDFSAYADMDR